MDRPIPSERQIEIYSSIDYQVLAASFVDALARIEHLEAALTAARKAIASLPGDVLGMVTVPPEADGETGYQYPIRDELLANIDAVLRGEQAASVALQGGEG